MKIKQAITLDDILDYIGINYDGVKEEIIKLAAEATSIEDFLRSFVPYYDKYGLGGDDTWMDVQMFLPVILEGGVKC